MSDGYESDEVMWASGERDLKILLDDIDNPQDKTVLEIGCGVGRILKAALEQFKKVIGVDVSEKALAQAKRLITHKDDKLTLYRSNGYELGLVESSSVDVVYSFAALSSMPTDVMSAYLAEMHRVLKEDGVCRLQLYLGSEQSVKQDDTLHLRCYNSDCFKSGVERAGFSLKSVEELKLPLQVSFKEIGIGAVVVTLVRKSRASATPSEISSALLPGGESRECNEVTGKELEYWMVLNYAHELAKSGDIEKAKEALNFVSLHCKNTALDVGDLMERK